ncbi:E1/E4 protein [Human papillomavirus type 212]|uniref:E1/E4 protein n=1 Tax=Human papillomavirus type 212 TaxID=2060136 RepID=A0A2H4V8G5_9PAPI|nr:E1/E4 protein [Human papillomavirus type 212]
MADPTKALQGLLPALPRSASVEPPTPRPSRKLHSDEFKPRRVLVPRALLPEDEEHNKENLPYHQKEEEETGLLDKALSRLLGKWEEDLEQLREQVSRELDDCKKKLGIRP